MAEGRKEATGPLICSLKIRYQIPQAQLFRERSQELLAFMIFLLNIEAYPHHKSN